jgi:hypothetical protein
MASSKAGDTNVSANGYHYTRTETEWRLTNHLVAEEKIGRGLQDEERAILVFKDSRNLSPDNIRVVKKGKASVRRRRANVEARIAELQAELELLKEEEAT